MEFISQEKRDCKEGLNCHVISSFMEIFMKANHLKNKKWIKILGDFWKTIRDLPLEEVNDQAWCVLGELMENNLSEDWKNDLCESCLMREYIFHHSRQYTNMDYLEKFKKYDDYFQEADREEYERNVGGYYDDDDCSFYSNR